MRLVVYLLLSLAAGAAVYLGGAVIWCLADPKGAGVSLLFTIPLALLAAAIPALIGMIGLINSSALRQPDKPPADALPAPKVIPPTARIPLPAKVVLKPVARKASGDEYRATFSPDHSLA